MNKSNKNNGLYICNNFVKNLHRFCSKKNQTLEAKVEAKKYRLVSLAK
jgi:hypothetical protein